MEKFKAIQSQVLSFDKICLSMKQTAKKTGIKFSRKERRKLARALSKEKSGKYYRNDKYQVLVTYDPKDTFVPFAGATCIHLSIRRLDDGTAMEWSELMTIKNELVSPEFDCVMCFPNTQRIVDAANCYHLFGFQDAEGNYVPVPVGWGIPEDMFT
tara:strand:+ start:366 stop:833 length:468 start_codon:yes stop_codon:yes gene_type:complete